MSHHHPRRTPEWRAQHARKALLLWGNKHDTYDIGKILGIHESEACALLLLARAS
jgi:hypothetical protein